MALNTAILYDIENLVGGYKQLDVSELSLREIYETIVDTGVEGAAIQRAYANWSDPRLSILRSDIVELGIEPVQMFGFGRGRQKNASDIQLAIDAIEIAMGKAWVTQFVIVSGDGGFAFLAKKLHEFGRRVVGCAYKRATNRVFEAVCDDFIWLEEPQQSGREPAPGMGAEISNPIVLAFAKSHEPVAVADHDDFFEKAREVVTFVETAPPTRGPLTGDGLSVSVVAELLKFRIEDFNYFRFGFERLIDLVSFIIRKSGLCLQYRPPSEYRLVRRGTSLRGFVEVAAAEGPQEVHSAGFYRKLLARNYPGQPRYRLASVDTLEEITRFLCRNRGQFQDVPIESVIERLESAFEWEQGTVKDTVLALVVAGCFSRLPEDARLAEQRLRFRFDREQEALDTLRAAMSRKLDAILGESREDVIAELLPRV